MKQRTRSMHGGDDMVGYNMGKKNDANEPSEIQLHRIKPQDHFIEAQVQEGDTLQAIALRFYCSLSELKRINHIHKDNEIFARRTIKVPVTPYSVLTELIPTQPPEPTPSTSTNNSNTVIQELVNANNFNELSNQNNILFNNSHQKDDGHCAIDCNTVVMNSTVAPSIVPYTDSEQNELATEDTQLLPTKEKTSVEAVVVKELTSHGADFGLKWFHLVCVMLILGVVIPLVYVLFYLPKPEHEVSDLPPLHSNR
ncbi:lysM and putative peptidoglycan-binding domain-containing protein 3 [Anticarsia gemmatalis]|uniref:lysM and putative peptidoglycan-binding domain-containing protein 3 n=1 Tax=Anticarsia gemmatalis TaxID=129554 RepID=UPI003F76973A